MSSMIGPHGETDYPKKSTSSHCRWESLPVISTCRRLRQEVGEFKAGLNYTPSNEILSHMLYVTIIAKVSYS